MNENIHPTTDNESSELPEAFVASFKKLLLNVSGDTETLNTFHSMISDEIERASNPDDNSDIDLFSSTNNKSTDIEEETVEEADTNVQSQSKLYSTNDLVAHVPLSSPRKQLKNSD